MTARDILLPATCAEHKVCCFSRLACKQGCKHALGEQQNRRVQRDLLEERLPLVGIGTGGGGGAVR